MTHEIKVNVRFDAGGFENAVKAYLVGLVTSGQAKYDQETYDLIVARAEQMVGDFIKTETVTARMNPELLALLDSIEADVQRMRIDLPLKTSIIAKLDQARVLARSVSALDCMAENAQELGLGY